MTNTELEKYHRSYEDMFRSEGWKNYLEDIKNSAEVLNSIEACADEKDLYFRKGQLAVIATVLNLPTQIEVMKQQLIEEEEQEVA
tara:strand:+ start:55 stop:309 length:255 start_codon:yes stop_codon:yes gene_type:complete